MKYKIEDVWKWTDDMIDHDATKIQSIITRLKILKDLVNSNIKHIIDIDIKILKSDKAKFDDFDVNYYNDMFRKIKGRSK